MVSMLLPSEMELITGLLLAILAVIGSIYYFSANWKLRRIPGPAGYPIVGNALQMDPLKPHETLRKWANQYGDIFRIKIFGEVVIVANSYEAITEVMATKSNDYAGRPFNFRCETFFGDEGISFADVSPRWSYMKKSAMTGIKQIGDHVTELEEILQTPLDELIDAFTNWKGKTVDVRDQVDEFVNSIAYILIFGRPVPDGENAVMANISWELSVALNPTSDYAVLDNFPFLRGFWYNKYREFKKIGKRCRDFHAKHLKTTIEEYNGQIRCALDGMIKEMKEPSRENMRKIEFGNIASAASTLTAAAVLTTSFALYYLLSLLPTNPDMQEEAYENIIKAIGDRTPSLSDRFSMPYIESMMLELLRLISHVPISVPHKTMKDTTLLGREIPAGTQIWPNLWNLHHDEKLWDDPWQFKPKRFLDEDGNLVKADHPLRKQFYAFGAGRRVCVGEVLAKHRMFLFIVSVIQKFRFVVPKGHKIATDPREFELGFALRPMDYNVQIELRK